MLYDQFAYTIIETKSFHNVNNFRVIIKHSTFSWFAEKRLEIICRNCSIIFYKLYKSLLLQRERRSYTDETIGLEGKGIAQR